MRFRLFLAVLVLVSLASPVLLAQTSGSVSGVVTGPDGAPLPGATVTISARPFPSAGRRRPSPTGAFVSPD